MRPISFKRHALLTTVVVAIGLLSLGMRASGYDGTYTGTIECDLIPGQTVGPLKTKFLLNVSGGRVEYERELVRPSSEGASLGVTERGTGTVSSSGEVSLTGSATGPMFSYEAIYWGFVDGEFFRLTGAQIWRLPDKASHERLCKIAVPRSER